MVSQPPAKPAALMVLRRISQFGCSAALPMAAQASLFLQQAIDQLSRGAQFVYRVGECGWFAFADHLADAAIADSAYPMADYRAVLGEFQFV